MMDFRDNRWMWSAKLGRNWKYWKHNLQRQKWFIGNSDLNFENPEKLINSLEKRPNNKTLLRAQDSLDESVLRHFLKLGTNNILYHKI